MNIAASEGCLFFDTGTNKRWTVQELTLDDIQRAYLRTPSFDAGPDEDARFWCWKRTVMRFPDDLEMYIWIRER